jgi:hypothetical protein
MLVRRVVFRFSLTRMSVFLRIAVSLPIIRRLDPLLSSGLLTRKVG